MNFLTRIEEILLLAVWKLRDNAYGISIREQVVKDTGVGWLSGAIYAPLNRLKKNGYIAARTAKGSGGSGGRPRVYYILTPRGREELCAIQAMTRDLWSGVPMLRKQAGGP
ncbi:MAG: helix-turn-helix transcriptional regulator [Acidobacteriota bacterium]